MADVKGVLLTCIHTILKWDFKQLTDESCLGFRIYIVRCFET